MNCSTCGTQLPVGATNCPRCGTPTSYDYALASSAPDDPTVMSSSYANTQQPAPPPPMYDSPSYHNPYETYDITPTTPQTSQTPQPPLPRRSGRRIGIIAGVVILVLLMISGGVFAWLAYSSTRNGGAAAQHFTAKGTATILSSNTTDVRQDGQNKVYSITLQQISYGDISGSFMSQETSVVHPDSTANFSGNSTCVCTVNGKSGTLMWSFSGTSTADGSFQGQYFDIHGTGDLANIHGQGQFQGQGSHDTYSSDLYFAP